MTSTGLVIASPITFPFRTTCWTSTAPQTTQPSPLVLGLAVALRGDEVLERDVRLGRLPCGTDRALDHGGRADREPRSEHVVERQGARRRWSRQSARVAVANGIVMRQQIRRSDREQRKRVVRREEPAPGTREAMRRSYARRSAGRRLGLRWRCRRRGRDGRRLRGMKRRNNEQQRHREQTSVRRSCTFGSRHRVEAHAAPSCSIVVAVSVQKRVSLQ